MRESISCNFYTSLLLSPTQPLFLHRPYPCTPEDKQGSEQDPCREAVAEEPDAEEKTNKLAHIERDSDTDGGCPHTEQIDAADADVLCKCIGSEIQNLSWYGNRRPCGH